MWISLKREIYPSLNGYAYYKVPKLAIYVWARGYVRINCGTSSSRHAMPSIVKDMRSSWLLAVLSFFVFIDIAVMV